MDHETAIRTYAAERYALGEMEDNEAGAFEEHFFDCRYCAQDVRHTVSFADNAATAFQEEATAPADLGEGVAHGGERQVVPAVPNNGAGTGAVAARAWRRPSTWVPAAAALAFLAVAIYQAAVVIPRLERFSVPFAAAPTVLRVVRAAPPVVSIAEGQPMFPLAVDVNVAGPASRYRLDFARSTGEPVTSLEAEAPANGTLIVFLPAAEFPEGEYTMSLRAVDSNEAAGDLAPETYRFLVEVTRKPQGQARSK